MAAPAVTEYRQALEINSWIAYSNYNLFTINKYRKFVVSEWIMSQTSPLLEEITKCF